MGWVSTAVTEETAACAESTASASVGVVVSSTNSVRRDSTLEDGCVADLEEVLVGVRRETGAEDFGAYLESDDISSCCESNA